MQVKRVPVTPELISWARKRAGYSLADLTEKFKKLPDWESGEVRPTLNQVQAFARKVHVPLGYLFCSKPPAEHLPILDFRIFSGNTVTRPSPNLLDTIYACQSRQDWYREYALVEEIPTLDFIGSVTIEASPNVIAQQIAEIINFDFDSRPASSSWLDTLRYFIRQVDKAGILVNVSGIVASNSKRTLDPDEFRGFALSDSLAPLVFVNGADTKSVQMFTLAHELAHLWLGNSALSNSEIVIDSRSQPEEIWCNAVATELLVPLTHFCEQLRIKEPIHNAYDRLARLYKVSPLIILRRLLDAGRLERREFRMFSKNELKRLFLVEQERDNRKNFYQSTTCRVGRRFASALVSSTLEGKTLYRDAYQLLGISRADSFDKLAREIGVYS